MSASLSASLNSIDPVRDMDIDNFIESLIEQCREEFPAIADKRYSSSGNI